MLGKEELWFTQVVGVAAVKADVQLYVQGMDALGALFDLYASVAMFNLVEQAFVRYFCSFRVGSMTLCETIRLAD